MDPIAPPSALAPWRQRLRESRWLALMDFALVAAVFVADDHHLILISKTLYLLALAWISMALRGVRWRDLGLTTGPRWVRLLLAGVLAGVAMEMLELFVTQPLLVRITGHYPDLSDFRDLVSNLKLLAVALVGTWTLAAFGEELVWRGHVMNRFADLFGRSRPGWIAALLCSSIAFGFAHAYQGWTGVAENAFDGALLAGMYLASGRNLTVPIVAHGMTDTIDFLIMYLGRYPGL